MRLTPCFERGSSFTIIRGLFFARKDAASKEAPRSRLSPDEQFWACRAVRIPQEYLALIGTPVRYKTSFRGVWELY